MAKAIAAGLGRDLDRVRVSVFRSNLFYEAHRCENREEKVRRVVQICHDQRKKGEGCGIVYVSSRKDAEQIAGILRDRGIGAIPYHAGLDPAVRARNQDQFMRDEPRAQVVVATVAFGMGVDKPDVRFIVHLFPPRSLEAYAQESGRAGRDGKPARCVLLYAPADQTSLRRQAKRDLLDLDDLRPIYAGIKRAAVGRWAILDPDSLLPPPAADEDPDEAVDPRVALGILEQAGLVFRHPDTPIARILRPLLTPSHPAESLSPEDEAAWQRLAAWAGLDGGPRAAAVVQTADACAALDLTPSDLDRLLGAQTAFAVRDERRAVCLEVLPAGEHAAAHLRQVLERATIEANRRIDQVMTYAVGRSCRHATLAAHLGERLPPCRTACDVCAKPAVADDVPASNRPAAPSVATAQTNLVTAADARAILTAVRTLPFPMGKTGLTKLLIGSVESRLRADRSPSFGALAHLKKGRIEELIDRMVEDGLLTRDLNHEFKVITLSRLGATVTDDLLEEYATPVRAAVLASPPKPGSVPSTGDQEPLDEVGGALYERLVAWRRQQASTQGVSAFIVADNKALRAIASVRPSTLDELSRLPGFGPTRLERYGEEVLEIVAASS
jgi:ATP-dependent DNA helicase RecQ